MDGEMGAALFLATLMVFIIAGSMWLIRREKTHHHPPRK
jgi:heme/copper-type cytochrome/quinol oxidase subunit 4